MEEFQKRAVACTKNQRERERKNKGEDIVVSEIRTYGETRKGDERERERGRKALRGRERKWPVQGGWNHLGFRYIER